MSHLEGSFGRQPRGLASVEEVLELVRTHLDVDVAFVGRFADSHREFKAVAASRPADRALQGSSDPLEHTYCKLVADGTLRVVVDALEHPTLARMPGTSQLGIRTHLGTPIHLPDGELYGTLCCFSRTVQSDLSERDARLLRFVADVIAQRVADEERERLALERVRARVEALVESGQPRMVFQPIMSLTNGETVGVEALARFDALPARGPDEWLADAHRAGVGAQLEATAIRRALQHLPRLPEPLRLSVNISARALSHPEVTQVLQSARGDRLVVEITEHEQHVNLEDLAAHLATLRRGGARIALDDVGEGYAGLRRVIRLLPDRVKLDRSLVRRVNADPVRRALIVAAVTFTDSAGIELVAEGVETQAECEALREIGVTLGQGYHLGRPVDSPACMRPELAAR